MERREGTENSGLVKLLPRIEMMVSRRFNEEDGHNDVADWEIGRFDLANSPR